MIPSAQWWMLLETLNKETTLKGDALVAKANERLKEQEQEDIAFPWSMLRPVMWGVRSNSDQMSTYEEE